MRPKRTDWTVDLSACLVWHKSGLSISFEGVPGTSHFGGSPTCPEGLPHNRFLALVREGFQLYREESQRQLSQNLGTQPSRGRTPIIIRRRPRLTHPNSPDTQ